MARKRLPLNGHVHGPALHRNGAQAPGGVPEQANGKQLQSEQLPDPEFSIDAPASDGHTHDQGRIEVEAARRAVA